MSSLAAMHALADLLLPRRCPCGAGTSDVRPGHPASAVCPGCRALLLEHPSAPVRPYPRPRGLPPCAAATAYAGGVRRCLIAYKERGRRALAQVLALALVKTLRELSPMIGVDRPVLLVPVPPSRAALRSRGFDHVALLVQHAIRLLPRDVRAGFGWGPLLRPVRRVADQAGLPAAARARNVAGALAMRPGLPRSWAGGGPPRVVLVDDVLTSGATLAEAARALRVGGIQTHNAVVVAAVLRPDRPGSSALPSRGRTG